MVLGLSEDKDVDGILAALTGPWRSVVTTRSQAPRAMDDRRVAERVQAAWPFATVVPGGDVASAVERAIASREPGEHVLICGSLFVVGEAMTALGADLEQL
jgi:folylpolyglutamate synthase/dihydropteroate synthase